MSQQAAKRRRRQAVNGYKHLPPLKRPHYVKRDPVTAARRLRNMIERQHRMQQGKAKK